MQECEEMDDFPPPGFRFYPTEEELVSFYLKSKLEGTHQADIDVVIPVLNIYDHDPWDLPQFAGRYNRDDPEQWFFFIPMQDREARGGRPTRLTAGGFWKATGSPGLVYSANNRVIGGKRTMVFYRGRAPNGKKTDWKINEYRSLERESSNSTTVTIRPQEFSLCRVYKKTKCVRAFDRRPACPPAPAAGRGESVGQLPPRALAINEASTSSPQKGEAAAACSVDKRSSSLGSSSSSLDHGGDSDNGGASWDISGEILWEWDQFNLF